MGDEDFWPDAQSERGEVARGAHIDVDAGGDQAAGGQPSRAEGYANAFMQLVGTHGGGRRADRVGVQRLGHPRQGWSAGPAALAVTAAAPGGDGGGCNAGRRSEGPARGGRARRSAASPDTRHGPSAPSSRRTRSPWVPAL